MKANKKKATSIKSVDPSDIKNHKIFSYTSSKSPGGGNRKKIITVRGVPGSTFALLAQNEDGEVYSFQGGGFDRVATSFRGKIPASGVFKSSINMQRSTSVDVRLIGDAPEEQTQVFASTEKIAKCNFSADTTGLSGNAVVSGTYETPSVTSGRSTSIKFEFIVTMTGNAQVYNIVRKPNFTYKFSNDDKKGSFVLYDGAIFKESGGDLVNVAAHVKNVDGSSIFSDVKYNPIADGSNPVFQVVFENIKALNQEEIPDNSVGHSIGFSDGLVITGTLKVEKMGAKDSNIKLMLFNFLELLTR